MAKAKDILTCPQDQTLSRKPQLCRPSRIALIPRSLPIVQKKAGERVPPIKTQARSATILPNFVGLKFQIHNGKSYNDLTITEDMVGHKLGEFAPYVPNETNEKAVGRNYTQGLANGGFTGHGSSSHTSRRRTSKNGLHGHGMGVWVSIWFI